jgi:hypothetical protein
METHVDSVVDLARTATSGASANGSLPDALETEIALLADALCRLGNTEQPWPTGLLEDVRVATDRTVSRVATTPLDRATALEPLLDATAVDIAALTGVDERSAMRETDTNTPKRSVPT